MLAFLLAATLSAEQPATDEYSASAETNNPFAGYENYEAPEYKPPVSVPEQEASAHGYDPGIPETLLVVTVLAIGVIAWKWKR